MRPARFQILFLSQVLKIPALSHRHPAHSSAAGARCDPPTPHNSPRLKTQCGWPCASASIVIPPRSAFKTPADSP
ncbi:hypothetical protein C8F04DRAFT_1141461 [Mycena alexandri]|uniref:Uncharacterized protein n=1 Tax=Mycena alexandri TaxID=1745969 RepID=A0AAD6S7K0_9AGAR|nr:hypothetical protein C8F04DRAFT_1141461 [Mycena alexandri]